MPGQYTVRQPLIPIGPSIAYVPLSQGLYALVDREDASLFRDSPWYAARDRTGHVYAKRNNLTMHAALTGRKLIDHANRNTLDNRRINLRPATPSQNAFNAKKRADNTSGFKGVHLVPSGKWKAAIYYQGRKVNLGRHATPELAHEAYRQALLLYAGEFGSAG